MSGSVLCCLGHLILLALRDASLKLQAKHRNTMNEKLNIN